MEGANLSMAKDWIPASRDLSNAMLRDCNLSYCDLSGVDFSGANIERANFMNSNLTGARMPAWDSGLMEGVKLVGAIGWSPNNRDMSNAKFKGVDLSHCDLSNFNLSGADLRDAILRNANLFNADLTKANLSGAQMQGARGGRQAVLRLKSDIGVGKPSVFALNALPSNEFGLSLRHVTVRIKYFQTAESTTDVYTERSQDANAVEIPHNVKLRVSSHETGPWTTVPLNINDTGALDLCRYDKDNNLWELHFEPGPDAPLIQGFVEILVQNILPHTGGGCVYVDSITLSGAAWGIAFDNTETVTRYPFEKGELDLC
jgi:uncharacterized protein YjbI with pentapeptide repeats